MSLRIARIATALLLLASAAVGPAAAEDVPAPGMKRMKNICMLVGGFIEDGEPGSTFKYRYQRAFHAAAGVDVAKDDAAEARRKISEFWALHQAEIRCNSLQFDVANGSLLKYAAVTNFDAFLHDVVAWGLDLNYVDPSDQRTVLDYIRHQMERSPGSATAKQLQGYYDLLRKAGAKHRVEL